MIRMGTVGTGEITRRFADAVAQVGGVEISLVYSRNARRAAEFAAQMGVAASVASLDALVNSVDIDAVYIGSPNHTHHGVAMAALRARKHVLVEKPAVRTVREWDELVAEAATAGVVMLEGMRTEYDTGFVRVRESLPLLGTIRRASFGYQKRSSRYDQVLGGGHASTFDPAMGGGALMDLGVYCVHAMVSLFGPPQRISAVDVPIPAGVDGAGVAIAGYPGFAVDVSYSKITTSHLPSEIQGEEATLVIDHISSPRTLAVHNRDGRVDEWVVDAEQDSLVGEVVRFAQLIGTRSDPGVDQHRTRLTLEVLDMIRQAAARPRG